MLQCFVADADIVDIIHESPHFRRVGESFAPVTPMEAHLSPLYVDEFRLPTLQEDCCDVLIGLGQPARVIRIAGPMHQDKNLVRRICHRLDLFVRPRWFRRRCPRGVRQRTGHLAGQTRDRSQVGYVGLNRSEL